MKKTRATLVAVGLVALVLGGTAVAAKTTGHSTRAAGAARVAHHGPGDDLAAAAAYLGTTVASLQTQLQGGKTLAQVAAATTGKSKEGLVAALVAHEKQELADAVAAGRLTQAQSDTIAASLTQRFTDLVDGVRPAMGPGLGHGPGHGDGGGLQAAATYLGISTDSLLTQLRSGKTLAQIANATSGKSASGLIDALVAAATARFGPSVPSDLRQHVTDLVNGTMPAMGPGMWPRHNGPFHDRGGFGPWQHGRSF